MADTRVQVAVEDWIRDEWMPGRIGGRFHRNRLELETGGVFDFDAVSDDRRVAACISTSCEKTAGGKNGSGKMNKIRADMLFLMMTPGLKSRLIVLTEEDMYNRCVKEAKSGRTPPGIEFLLAQIPEDLRKKLDSSRRIASDEVS